MSMILRIGVALALAVGFGLLMNYDEGTVSINLPPYSYDLLFKWVALGVILGALAIYLLVLLVTGTLALPQTLSRFGKKRRHTRSLEFYNDSVMALNEGRHEKAEELAGRAQKDESLSGPAALVAARASHALGATDRRNRWLLLVENDKNLNQARQIFLVEMALDEQRASDALVALDLAQENKGADTMQILRLRLRAHEQAADWHEVIKAANMLQKLGGINEQAGQQARSRAWQALFAQADGDLDKVKTLHKSVSKQDLNIDGVSEAAAEAYAVAADHNSAAKLVQSVMNDRLSSRMLVLYTRLDAIDTTQRLRVAEGWLQQYKDDEGSAMITAVLGRLCMAEGLWGKAEAYLKEANARSPSPFTRLALAEMYDQLGRGDEASGLYRSIARDQPHQLSAPVLALPAK